MSTTTELAELFELAGRLRHTVMALRARHAATPAMRRILLDADRILGDLDLLDADAQELGLSRYTPPSSGEKIQVPHAGYGDDFWRDVDDEGVGGQPR
ncbi:hypothetical protein [Mycolicibacterium fallax]|uniref:Uncharacterized protein n=1 Tax=Mycolicibacterium fallax TaxID=1793 RepID=A0A1X1R908_MYCFA|nr:hypothetical protein [Mycolicibacterium fallax]ORV01615.1 hypothetical protein AWC04_13625 [Mycolicibacterium fallax]BBY98980.1 hypothetical protein MFAL_24470 [Mycolicibacterium fallax]HOW95036.1 hypothetical protein [Mycolicibacterium fallax]HSA40653.1 hypothetical protein [Mycobacterium sp.]